MNRTNEINPSSPSNGRWQSRYLMTGTVCGAALGLAAAYFLVRSSEKSRGGPPDISTTDLLRSTVGVIGIIRGIASLGE